MFILIWFILGIATAVVASNNGGNFALWLILGILFGFFALIFAFFVPGKKCISCKKKIHTQASVCPYCNTPQ